MQYVIQQYNAMQYIRRQCYLILQCNTSWGKNNSLQYTKVQQTITQLTTEHCNTAAAKNQRVLSDGR